MKKIIIFFLFLLSCGKRLPDAPSLNEGVERIVLAESFSATRCVNCPQADAAMYRLSEEYGRGKLVVVQYHPTQFAGDDPFGTKKTDAKISSYGVGGYPIAFFDGRERMDGAPADIYEQYKKRIETEIQRKSPITISMSGNLYSTNQATVNIEIKVVAPISQQDLVLHFIVIEDSIYYKAPNGDTLHRFVVREIIPDEKGESVSLSLGSDVRRIRNFSISPQWITTQTWCVAFIQSAGTKEVLQCATYKVGTLSYDFWIVGVDTVKTVRVGEIAGFYLRGKNIGLKGDTIVFDFPRDSLPQNWGVSICDNYICYQTPYPVYFAPLDTIKDGLRVEIAAFRNPGIGWAELSVRSIGDTTRLKILRFRAIAQ